MDMDRSKVVVGAGLPFPLGVHLIDGRYNFSLYCYKAAAVFLLLFEKNNDNPIFELLLEERTKDIWHISLEGIDPYYCYAYRIYSDFTAEYPENIVLDPYAKSVVGRASWGVGGYSMKAELPSVEPFNWEQDAPPNHNLQELLLYEMHVRGFTQHPFSKVAHPGSYLGVIEKIPYLLSLGINAVELLPCQEFDECENFRKDLSGRQLYNYWGYSTVAFFAPMGRYAEGRAPFAAITEFKQMVKELHKNKIEVILDIVFNHTAEGGREGPLISFKGLDPIHYYLIDEKGQYRDFTGCGNTFNCNHPIGMQFIIDCLRYWVIEMHVDGFRFDLAAVFSRGVAGEVLAWAPLIEALSTDPILSHVKLIAEAWDAVGLYQVGSFSGGKAWLEWNGRYRDQLRNFIKGSGSKNDFASRLCGSQDLYWNYAPTRSINFITAHDGFTLLDLVSYNQKHNLDNGEEDRDGMNQNDSWNCGVEGASQDSDIENLRERQRRNFTLALAISQGIPMWHMGDEYGHTKKGNNNTWCQDNELNWFLWDKYEANSSFFRFCQLLFSFRAAHPILRKQRFLSDLDVQWHGTLPRQSTWSLDDNFIALTLFDRQNNEEIYAAFNAQNKQVMANFPVCSHGKWFWIANSAKAPPEDVYREDEAPEVTKLRYTFLPYSSVLLLGKK